MSYAGNVAESKRTTREEIQGKRDEGNRARSQLLSEHGCISKPQATAKQGAARGSAARGACYQPYQPDSDPHCPPADRRELTSDLHTLWCPRMHVCTGVNMHANKQTNGEERERLGEACHSLGWWHSPLIPPFMGDQQFGAFLSSAVTTRPGWVT